MALQGTKDSLLGDLLKILLAVILPPLGVLVEVGLSFHFFLNIILTIFGFVPGIIHAVYIIVTR
ncbi:MAG: YqaE/Pmp3 family membrane protein [Micavibrio sp.]|nr:YqaE/Pmp3 family membrane protein [Micavibrio sp.]|tara:strand:- start:458 stop:649 length:192 start_codon:yes stop_codon:yes gene_type:complete